MKCFVLVFFTLMAAPFLLHAEEASAPPAPEAPAALAAEPASPETSAAVPEVPAAAELSETPGIPAAPVAPEMPPAPETPRALHGGFFQKAGDVFYYELVIPAPGTFQLHIYDETGKPLPVSGISARYSMPVKKKKPLIEGNFAEEKDGRFYTSLYPHPASGVIRVRIEARKDGRWVPADFKISPQDLKGAPKPA